jgi:cysteine desulfurase
MKQRIYMDANATTPLTPEVMAAMQPFWEDRFGNASAVHGFGRGARAAIDGAREQIAALVGGKASEVTFTSGGTESDNLALFGMLHPGDHLVVSAIEHDAVLHAADALEEMGVLVSRVGCDFHGVVDPADVSAAIRENTRLVSLMLANNETGAIQPIREVAGVVHAAGALLHTDAVQAGGKIAIDVKALGCDLLSLSAHKMHGPQGVGALWSRSGLPLRPMLHGGSHERQRRAGTENVPGIVGFGRAAELTGSWLAEGGAQRLTSLRDRLEHSLRARIPETTVNSGHAERLPNTSCLSFGGVNAEELVIALDLQGLAISGGAACQSGAIEPSHVLRAMGLDEREARSSVRFSLSRLTAEEDVDAAIQIVTAAVERLRSV